MRRNDLHGTPTILLVASLDTKGVLVSHLKFLLEKEGAKTIILDVGFSGKPTIQADITREEVLAAQEICLQSVQENKAKVIDCVSKGAQVIIRKLFDEGKIHGAVGMGGGVGTILSCNAMKTLPIGFPKLVISTLPYDIRHSIGASDILFLYSVADVLGLNPITRTLLDETCAAILGMARRRLNKLFENEELPTKKNIGVTALGITTKATIILYEKLVRMGYEVTVFHANGIGGAGFETAAREGMFDAVIDLTTHEINHRLFETPVVTSGDRLGDVLGAKIPYIFVPGGLDVITQGPVECLKAEYKCRPYHIHSGMFTHVRVSEEEASSIAKYVAEKLNKNSTNVAVCIPLKGFSEMSLEGSNLYSKQADKNFVKTLKDNLSSDVNLIEVEANINDAVFLEKLCQMLTSLLGQST